MSIGHRWTAVDYVIAVAIIPQIGFACYLIVASIRVILS